MSAQTLDRREPERILRSLRRAQGVRLAGEDERRDDPGVARRSYGTGSLFLKYGSWYGQWRVDGRLVKRKLGPVRKPGTLEGLTRAQAERALRRKMESEGEAPVVASRVTVEQAGTRLIAHLEALGRKPTTMKTYRSLLSTHIATHLDGERDRQRPDDVEDMIAAMARHGAGPKLIVNALTLLHQIFEFGRRKGWCRTNPCKSVDRRDIEENTDIRFLALDEVEALIRAVPEAYRRAAAPFVQTDRTLFLVAALTGLRQGELLALRWRDVDWVAGRIRVRPNYVRGHWGTPKSRRGSRSVPMVDRVAGELERHFKRSAYQGDDDRVFCHPQLGSVLSYSSLGRRFKKALKSARVRPVRFNDLRHTFGTHMAAAGVPMRTLQEWMGHRDYKTTLIYADYAPSAHEAQMAERAFSAGINSGINLSESERSPKHRNGSRMRVQNLQDPRPQG
jgi:integrase